MEGRSSLYSKIVNLSNHQRRLLNRLWRASGSVLPAMQAMEGSTANVPTVFSPTATPGSSSTSFLDQSSRTSVEDLAATRSVQTELLDLDSSTDPLPPATGDSTLLGQPSSRFWSTSFAALESTSPQLVITTTTATKTSHSLINIATRTLSTTSWTTQATTSSVETVIETNQASSPSQVGTVPDGATAAIAVGVVILIASLAYVVWHIQSKKRQRKPRTFNFDSLSSPRTNHLPMDDLYPDRPFSPPVNLESWLAHQHAGNSGPNTDSGTQSPPPRPAVAELQSFTRSRQKPRIYDVGRSATSNMCADQGHSERDKSSHTASVKSAPNSTWHWDEGTGIWQGWHGAEWIPRTDGSAYQNHRDWT